ncbi:ParA family protein [Aeromonas veronii]
MYYRTIPKPLDIKEMKLSSYVVWANKGGIGKSTLTFQLACETATLNPGKKVLVIDLSPQCDVSRMILGGGHYGGEEVILSIMQTTPRQTVQSYLLECLNSVPAGLGWPDPRQFIVYPNQLRTPEATALPNNLELLCGDFDLERTIQLIDQLPQPPRRFGRAPTGPEYSTYLLTRSFLRHVINVLNTQGDYIVLIDTDPYFNVITTQMGLLAADRWITAYSPSSQASQYAVLRSVEFLYEANSGLYKTVEDEKAKYPGAWFDNRGNIMQKVDVSTPLPHCLISNMTTPYARAGNISYTDPQKLHRQTIDEMQADVLAEVSKFNIPMFTYHEYMWNMNRLGLICDYNGLNLHSLQVGHKYKQPGSTRGYPLTDSKNPKAQLEGYQRKLEAISSLL